MTYETAPLEGPTPLDQAEQETGAVALLHQRDSVYALSEKAMTGLLAQFLLGVPDVDGIRIVEATSSIDGWSVQVEVVDRYGEGRSFQIPAGRWRVGY